MTLLPKVKLKALVAFPATILDGTGIDVIRESGTFQFDLAFADFAPPVGALPDASNLTALLWNSVHDQYVLSPISLLAGGGSGSGVGLGDPVNQIGLTPINGISTTAALRYDSAPALSQAIIPSWTGQHTWSGGGVQLGVGSAPPLAVGVGVHPYFGSGSNTWQLINANGSSDTVPETGLQSIITSSNGGANPHTAFKIGLFVAGTFNSGAAAGYGANFVANATTGFSNLLTGLEIDLNQGSGLDQGVPGSLNASYNLVLSGNPSPAHPATAAIWITGSAVWTNGIYISNGIVGNTITDVTSSGISYVISGSHSYGIDTTQGSFSGPVFHLGNNQRISWLNAASNSDLQGISINASDQLVLGASGVSGVRFNSSAMFVPNGGVSTIAFGAGTAHAAIGTPGSVNKWLAIRDDAGNQCWIPVWR